MGNFWFLLLLNTNSLILLVNCIRTPERISPFNEGREMVNDNPNDVQADGNLHRQVDMEENEGNLNQQIPFPGDTANSLHQYPGNVNPFHESSIQKLRSFRDAAMPIRAVPVYGTVVHGDPNQGLRFPGSTGTIYGNLAHLHSLKPSNTYVLNPSQNSIFRRPHALDHPELSSSAAGFNSPQMTNTEFSGTLQERKTGPNLGELSDSQLPTKLKEFEKGQLAPSGSVDSEVPSTSRGLSKGKLGPSGYFISESAGNSRGDGVSLKRPEIHQLEADVPKKIVKTKAQAQYPNSIQETVPQKSTLKNVGITEISKFYRSVFKSNYNKCLKILHQMQEDDLHSINRNMDDKNLLRFVVNKLALLQVEQQMSLTTPEVLWYSQIVTGPQNIALLNSLQGYQFRFNDITMLTSENPMKNLILSEQQYEIRYHVTTNNAEDFVDLRKFHEDFSNYYIALDDMSFTVTKVVSIGDTIFQVELESQKIVSDLWISNRERQIIDTWNNYRLAKETPRMKSITNSVNFITENVICSPFDICQEHLKTFLLSKKSSKTLVPSYQTLAEDFTKLTLQHDYNQWKIEPHPYIRDVLFDYYLDDITEFSEAERRIDQLYSLVYDKNTLQEAFEKYKNLHKITQNLRFEDYYVIYAHLKGPLSRNEDVVRRLEAAFCRLALRQCDEEWILKPITIYAGIMISSETADKLKACKRGQTVSLFDLTKVFSSKEKALSDLKETSRGPSDILLFVDLKLNNQAGVANVGRVMNDRKLFHLITREIVFEMETILFRTRNGQNMLNMRVQDSKSPVESRMLLMASKLRKLFATETQFYSNSA